MTKTKRKENKGKKVKYVDSMDCTQTKKLRAE